MFTERIIMKLPFFSEKDGRSRGELSRLLSGLLVFSLALTLWGCGFSGAEDMEGSKKGGSGNDSRLAVAVTLFPYYDFVRQVAGDRVKLELVVPAGMDSHSFEPTPADVIKIQEADVFLYNGGHMEHWVEEVLDSLDRSQMIDVRMMDYVDVLEEELVEGMEDAEHGHDHEDGEEPGYVHDHDHEEDAAGAAETLAPGQLAEIEYDEHIWTSPVNAMTIVDVICQALCGADPDNQAIYEANAAAYKERLSSLDEAFRETVNAGTQDMLVVADRFPFRYLTETYGLSYRAAFAGCSGDTEPSARTIAYLIDQVREKELPAVYYLELSSHRVAEIISEETGAKPLLLHSCHNVTRQEFEEGVTYLQLMEQNVENLRIGLGVEGPEPAGQQKEVE